MTDDVLLEFEKSPDALDAARNLQDEFHESARKLNLPTPGLRSGIHYGNVERSQDGALLGDTVEIASRVQGIAEVGQIVLSGRVVDQLKDKIELEDLGERSLENVPEPVRFWAVGN